MGNRFGNLKIIDGAPGGLASKGLRVHARCLGPDMPHTFRHQPCEADFAGLAGFLVDIY